MSQVFIRCPETGRPVYTGFNFEWPTFETIELEKQSLDCPCCGSRHEWRKDDAYLRTDGGGD